MTLTQQTTAQLVNSTSLPSFSIVYETENLSSVELENIYRSLASLAAQSVAPETANEFMIIDGGNAPPEVIAQICSTYPWVTVQKAPGISYYAAKMTGANLATGEIIIFCDSDCVYEPTWVEDVLSLFTQKPDANVVAGEVSLPVRNLYELAVAIHYFFPRFTNKKEPYPSTSYYLNSVAFRREFLLRYPIPFHIPLYRGQCQIHYDYLCRIKGQTIWKHPKARAVHEPPTLAFAFWRYLLMGHDFVVKQRVMSALTHEVNIAHAPQLADIATLNWSQRLSGIVSVISGIQPYKWVKIRPVLRESKRRLFLIPFTIPLVLWFELLYTIGGVITYLKPRWLLNLYGALEHGSETAIASGARSQTSV